MAHVAGNIFSISYKIIEHHCGAIDVTWSWNNCTEFAHRDVRALRLLSHAFSTGSDSHNLYRLCKVLAASFLALQTEGWHRCEWDAPDVFVHLDAVGSILGCLALSYLLLFLRESKFGDDLPRRCFLLIFQMFSAVFSSFFAPSHCFWYQIHLSLLCVFSGCFCSPASLNGTAPHEKSTRGCTMRAFAKAMESRKGLCSSPVLSLFAVTSERIKKWEVPLFGCLALPCWLVALDAYQTWRTGTWAVLFQMFHYNLTAFRTVPEKPPAL